MKFVLLAIFVLFAAQPLQASFCDISAGQEAGHGQHGNVIDDSMDHGDGQGMDCCDQDSEEPDDGCNSLSHCSACITSLAAVTPSTLDALFSPGPRQLLVVVNGILNESTSPPFRPPIA